MIDKERLRNVAGGEFRLAFESAASFLSIFAPFDQIETTSHNMTISVHPIAIPGFPHKEVPKYPAPTSNVRANNYPRPSDSWRAAHTPQTGSPRTASHFSTFQTLNRNSNSFVQSQVRNHEQRLANGVYRNSPVPVLELTDPSGVVRSISPSEISGVKPGQVGRLTQRYDTVAQLVDSTSRPSTPAKSSVVAASSAVAALVGGGAALRPLSPSAHTKQTPSESSHLEFTRNSAQTAATARPLLSQISDGGRRSSDLLITFRPTTIAQVLQNCEEQSTSKPQSDVRSSFHTQTSPQASTATVNIKSLPHGSYLLTYAITFPSLPSETGIQMAVNDCMVNTPERILYGNARAMVQQHMTQDIRQKVNEIRERNASNSASWAGSYTVDNRRPQTPTGSSATSASRDSSASAQNTEKSAFRAYSAQASQTHRSSVSSASREESTRTTSERVSSVQSHQRSSHEVSSHTASASRTASAQASTHTAS